MEKEDIKSANIVTSDYHMRRTKLTFDSVFKDSNIQLHYVHSPNKHFELNKWFMSVDGISEVGTEYAKIILGLVNADKMPSIQKNKAYTTLHSHDSTHC
jgi:uncharacterized SAM-binding protein YcdF (DUF218 family)